MATLKEILAANVRARRKEQKLTLATLAARCGLSVSYVSMIERGQRSPTLETCAALAWELGTTTTALLQKDGAAPKRKGRRS